MSAFQFTLFWTIRVDHNVVSESPVETNASLTGNEFSLTRRESVALERYRDVTGSFVALVSELHHTPEHRDR